MTPLTALHSPLARAALALLLLPSACGGADAPSRYTWRTDVEGTHRLALDGQGETRAR